MVNATPPGGELLQRTGGVGQGPLGYMYPFQQGAQRLVDAWDRLQAGGATMSEILAMIAEPGAFNPAAHFVQQQMDTMGMSIEQAIAHLRTILAQPGAGGPRPGLDTRVRVPTPEELRGRPVPERGTTQPTSRPTPPSGLLGRMQPASRPTPPSGAVRSYPTPPSGGAWAGHTQPSRSGAATGPRPALLSRLAPPVRPRSLAGAPGGQTARLRRLMGGF